MTLKGKTALVTGSTSGIGLGISRGLAGAGANILLHGLGDPKQIEDTRSRLAKETGVTVGFSGADLARPEGIAELFAAAQKNFGAVDILVNNAGIQHVAPIESFPLEQWNAVLALNLTAVFLCTQKALPQMKQRGWGRIVNIASAHGLVASANKSAYVAAKHGVVGLTKVTALETAGMGVTCNAICPGWVLTPLVQKQIDALADRENLNNEQASAKLLSEKQPSKQFVTPEQISALTLFLCSDAAAQISGSSYSIDGGWTAQ